MVKYAVDIRRLERSSIKEYGIEGLVYAFHAVRVNVLGAPCLEVWGKGVNGTIQEREEPTESYAYIIDRVSDTT